MMKDPMEVLRMKEEELQQVKKEVEALRITLQLLGEKKPAAAEQASDPRRVVEMP
jgi:hypothetical protein